jgi:Rrf2 family protein
MVSTKTEYALRALMYLGGHDGTHATSAREIAEAWSIPSKYLEQILKSLKDGGFVESQKGVTGGYRLARPAAEIVVGDVVRHLEGRVAPMGCVSALEYEPCEFEMGCGLKSLWARMRAAVVDVLDGTTIEGLLQTSHPAPTLTALTRS